MKVWEIDPKTFGEDLRNMRLDKQMTQADLAKQLHKVGVSSINNWEYSLCLPNLATLLDIAAVFGIDEIRVNSVRRWYA